MRKLVLSLLLTTLLAGCAGSHRSSCPEFPMPSEHVQQELDTLSAEDPEVWAWGNRLLDLCQQLGTCEEKE